MRKTKENGGITLVALVVTVVILLILAGVSISLVLGENGIVTKAKEAKYRQQVASIQDVIADELATIYIRRNEGETIDDNEKLDIIYSKLEENKLTSNVKKVANLVIVADKYVVSMTTGKEGELADPEKWVYQVQGEEGFDGRDSENENKNYNNWACIRGYKGTEKDITIPEYVLKDGTIYVIKVIRNWHPSGFEGNNNIESITVLDNITKIETSMFCGMHNLKKVTIPDTVTTIGNNAFGNDEKLEYVKLPANITEIAESTFYRCYALSEITIPNKVESIGKNAFALCLSIQKIEIPSSVKTIGEGAFGFMGIDDTADPNYGCGGASATDKYAEFGYQKGKLSEIILHEGLESVGEGAFRLSATVRKDLKLPTSLKDIGEQAFLAFGKVGGGKLYNSDGSLYTVN